MNGELVVLSAGTLILGNGAAIIGSGDINVPNQAELTIEGNLNSTGNATFGGTLGIAAGGSAQASNWNFTGTSLVGVHGYMTSPNPVISAGTVALGDTGLIDAPLINLDGAGATLSGSGIVIGPVEVGVFSIVSPGNSPGTLTVGSTSFSGGSTLELEIRDATGTSGVDYDLLAVDGDLMNQGTTSDPMNILLTSLDFLDDPGAAVNFDNTQSYDWTVATTTGSIGGFAQGTYLIDTSDFQNDLGSGGFFLALGNAGQSLLVHFSPDGISPSDFDSDGDVDGNDFLKWQQGFGSSYNTDGLTNWEMNFGGTPPAAVVSTTVPEPSALLLGAMAIAGLFARRRRTERCGGNQISYRSIAHQLDFQ